ncbi:MAG: HPr kinase/phosphorylase, partial [Christensenellales bacterium]|jgi:HPr kinase/phosphorylase
VSLPSILLPVRPGRNLAIIVEVAAMNYRLKKMGYDAAVEFDRRLLEQLNS